MKIAWFLFWRLDKQSIKRLVLTSFAIALGVMTLLVLLSGTNGLYNRFNQGGLFNAVYSGKGAKSDKDALKIAWFTHDNLNRWQNNEIKVLEFAKTSSNAPDLPNLRAPQPGEYYLSPKLASIMKTNPNSGLDKRYGNKYIGELPKEYLSSPDDLIAFSGVKKEDLLASNVPTFNYTDPKMLESSKDFSIKGGLLVIFAFGAVILLFPVAMLVSIATQLGSAQRERKYAAIRLIGGTRKQVRNILLFESLVTTLVGILGGILLHLMILPLISNYSFDGLRFFPEQLRLDLSQYFYVAVIILILSLVVNLWQMKKVQTSPLGIVMRHKKDKKPRIFRLIPFLITFSFFCFLCTDVGKKWLKDGSQISMILLLLAILGLMFSIVLAGSYITYWLSKLISKNTKRATILIASKRIKTQSKQVFRNVGGVVLALFAGSFFLTAVSGIDKVEQDSISGNMYSRLKTDTVLISTAQNYDLDQVIKNKSYIKSYTKIGIDLESEEEGLFTISCKDLATYIKTDCRDKGVVKYNLATNKILGDVSSFDFNKEHQYLVTLKSMDYIDTLRSDVLTNIKRDTIAYVISGKYANQPIVSKLIKSLSEITYAGILFTMLVAIFSLFVSTVGGLFERKRSLFTLSLGGMDFKQMKRMVLVESLIPLISVSVFASILGVWVGAIFMSIYSSSVKPTITPLYLVITLGCLAFAIVGINMILPVIKRITSLEENQSE